MTKKNKLRIMKASQLKKLADKKNVCVSELFKSPKNKPKILWCKSNGK